MRNTIVCLISFFLLSSVIAKASMLSNAGHAPISKSQDWEQYQEIDNEDDTVTTYDQLKNSEFMNSCHDHSIAIFSCNFQFSYLHPIIPFSYLERPDRPPKKDLFQKIINPFFK